MSSAALILAAGGSSRFEGQPKALRSVGERSAVRRIAEGSLAARLSPVVVVVGAHRSSIAHELRGLPTVLVEAEEWYEGRTASIQAGVRSLPSGSDVVLWPVDHPFVAARTIDDLEAMKLRDAFGIWFVPTYQGRGGHPVLWRGSVSPHVLELRSDAPLRSLLPEFGPQVRRFAVDDPGVVSNVDTPESYRSALELWDPRGRE